MFKKIKSFLEYKRNIRIVRTSLSKIGAATLPSLIETVEKSTDILKFILKLLEDCNNLGEEKLISTIINTIAAKFETDDKQLYDTIEYMSSLNVDEIKKILLYSKEKIISLEDN